MARIRHWLLKDVYIDYQPKAVIDCLVELISAFDRLC
jgi:hypothetical protein